MNTFDYLNEYHNTHDEDARLSPKRGQVEFFTTVRYVEKYLKAGMKILQIGAGTGRYSHYFAAKDTRSARWKRWTMKLRTLLKLSFCRL